MKAESDSKSAEGDVTPAASGTDPQVGARGQASRSYGGLLALAGLGLLVAAAGLAVWLGRDGSEPQARATASDNRPVNQDSGSINAHNSPTLVASPTNPGLLVVAGRVDRPQLSATLHISRDAGASWSDVAMALPPGQSRSFTPEVAFDSRGTLHVMFATIEGEPPANYPGALWVEHSTDGGASFSSPVKVTGPFAFQPRLAVNPDSGTVHVSWVQAGPSVVQQLASSVSTPASEQRNPGFGPPPNPVVMATSEDGGASFSPPVQVSDPKRLRVGGATPVIGRGGEISVLYEDFGDDVADFEGRPGPVHPGRFQLVLSSSTDGGRTFATRSVVEPEVRPMERFLVYLPRFPSVAVDPQDGTLYVAWADARNRDSDVFLRSSRDGGKTWSDRRRVNDDGSRRQQYLPQVAVAPGGRVDVVFLDRRQDPGDVLTQASLATSYDQGKTWKTLTVSDALFDSRVGPRNDRTTADPGSRIGLASTGTAAYAVWADTRRASPETDNQDLIFSTVRFDPA